jgi:DNA-binding transcriptional LysR family regulator
MERRHIHYFLVVAEERNFIRAAARVGIGQSLPSQQIKDLESEVGVPLFHRIPQGAELSGPGVGPGHSTAGGTRNSRGTTGGTWRNRRAPGRFTGSAPFNPIVTGAIRSFKRAYLDVDLSLKESNTARLIGGLRDNLLDAVFSAFGLPRR